MRYPFSKKTLAESNEYTIQNGMIPLKLLKEKKKNSTLLEMSKFEHTKRLQKR